MTTAKVELGMGLFEDPRLSVTGEYSCASCHRPELAFTDGLKTAIGATHERHRRNTPSLFNSAYNASFGWADPFTRTLEAQHRIPMFNLDPVELGTNETGLIAALEADDSFMARQQAAFGEGPVTLEQVIAALASYVRTLISGDSPFDRYLYFGEDAMSERAKVGMALFFSPRLGCATCHASFNLSGSVRSSVQPEVEPVFHNTGLSLHTPDPGLAEHTGLATDAGAFRAPSLRNIALTGPYMHDGSIANLGVVIDFYAEGGVDHPNRRPEVAGFELSPDERGSLIAFLEALTGTGARAAAVVDQTKP